ncbi:MAG: hypothetical protein JWN68_3188 [Nocardioides sp.]|jgi:anti-anti-sigma regulatory factor|uniref:hypothetical protein n=1 Tax=Nocardioides sp. TaxID=35761 RepID=UPI0026107E83|nr:hypothetical protein [Nocardioides sp.]MCW2835235.1 hypothetical protein [Nocardioides sp.]
MTTSKNHALRLVEPSVQVDEQPDTQPDETLRRLEITVQSGTDIHGVGLVLLSGEIDASAAPRLRTIVEKLVSERRRYILVDLDDLTSRDVQAYEDLVEGARCAVHRDVTVLFTSDPRCLLMLKIEEDPP